jgi:hypothetical protein
VTRNHDALTRVWAAELGPRGVTVNAVAPAFLALPDARWVTGQVLATTGGLAPKLKVNK